jgi:hypothetical protein
MPDTDLENGDSTVVEHNVGADEVYVHVRPSSAPAIGETLDDIDLFVVDNGAVDVIRKATAQEVYDYIKLKVNDVPAPFTGGEVLGGSVDIDGAVDIAAALDHGGDHILVYDVSTGIVKKAHIFRMKDYVVAQLNQPPYGQLNGNALNIKDTALLGRAIFTNDDFILHDGTSNNKRVIASSVYAFVRDQLYAGAQFPLSTLNINGEGDLSEDIEDNDLFVVKNDSGAFNTWNKKAGASRIKKYVNKIQTNSYAGGTPTLTEEECFGWLIYVTAPGTISLPAILAGMNVTIMVVGGHTVSVKPAAGQTIYLDGLALDADDKITSNSVTGDGVVLTYFSAGNWMAQTNGWTDGGP